MATYEDARKAVDQGNGKVVATVPDTGFLLVKGRYFKTSAAHEAGWEIYEKRKEYTVESVTAPGVCFDPREAKEIINQLGDKVTPSRVSPTTLVLPVKDNTFRVNYDAVFFNASDVSTFEKEISTREIVSDSGYLELNVSLPKGAKPGKWKVTCERIGGENV